MKSATLKDLSWVTVQLVLLAALLWMPAFGLLPFLGFIAAALGTTLAAWTMVAQLWWGRRDMGQAARIDDRLRRRFWRLVLASVLMGGCLWLGQIVLGPFLGLPGLRYAALAALIGIGCVSYFGLGALVGAFKLSDFRSALRRNR